MSNPNPTNPRLRVANEKSEWDGRTTSGTLVVAHPIHFSNPATLSLGFVGLGLRAPDQLGFWLPSRFVGLVRSGFKNLWFGPPL